MNKKYILIVLILLSFLPNAFSQTATSLFWRADSLQVKEIFSENGDEYRKVGHHGPAVENSHMAMRIYFNNSGAIDLYSKTGRGMELKAYKWYPTVQQQELYSAGCDEYKVGKTVGFGGIALWDGEKEVKLLATKGRKAVVGETKSGSFAQLIAYGVEYKGELVDISIRIDMSNKRRTAIITASELSGKSVQFLTGVNYHPNQQVKMTDKYLAAWGVHPADVSQNPTPIGAAIIYKKSKFLPAEKTENMLRLISKPTSRITTTVLGASTKEAEIRNSKSFFSFLGD